MKTQISPVMQKLLDLIHPPEGATTSPHTDELVAALETVHDAIEAAQIKVAQVQRARRKVLAAKVGWHEEGHLEHINQSSGGIERCLKGAAEQLDAAINSAKRLDEYAVQIKTAIETHDERMAEQEAKGGVVLRAGRGL